LLDDRFDDIIHGFQAGQACAVAATHVGIARMSWPDFA